MMRGMKSIQVNIHAASSSNFSGAPCFTKQRSIAVTTVFGVKREIKLRECEGCGGANLEETGDREEEEVKGGYLTHFGVRRRRRRR